MHLEQAMITLLSPYVYVLVGLVVLILVRQALSKTNLKPAKGASRANT